MNVEDYKTLREYEALSKMLDFELSIDDDKFCISNNEVKLAYFTTIRECLFYLKGYHQCKRILDKVYNKKVINKQNTTEV